MSMNSKQAAAKKSASVSPPEGRSRGRILKGVGGAYEILLEDGQRFSSKPRGIFRKQNMSPLPGDIVICQPSGDSDFPLQIMEIEPRRNASMRPPMANLDLLVLTFATKDPEPDLILLDKLLIFAAKNNIECLICFTKADLDQEENTRLLEMYRAAGFNVLSSSVDDWANTAISDEIKGRVVAFAGPSGVGKSTLLNEISGKEEMLTGEISERLSRGRHTTRHTELFPMLGGFLVDTPGFTSLAIDQLDVLPEELIAGYPEFLEPARECRFQDCHHLSERDCAVRDAAELSDAAKERYDRYCSFRIELNQLPLHHWKKKEN